MRPEELERFIIAIKEYFTMFSDEAIEIGGAYSQNSKEVESVIQDFTGAITVTGSHKGAIYISSGKPMLAELATTILGEGHVTEEDMIDLVGELANTIAGNVRVEYGNRFDISLPVVISGGVDGVRVSLPKLMQPVYIIPIHWKGFQFHMCIGLDEL